MKHAQAHRKIILATILTTGLSLSISQAAFAYHGFEGNRHKGSGACMTHTMNPAIQKAHERFMGETKQIRKQLAVKRASMRAIMMAGTPDPNKAAQLAGELFDLREQLRIKAREYGLPVHMALGGGKHGGDFGPGRER
ncbi:MAG: hypothetical protein CSA32_04320 [Desulfobulbus propionicus]|nr:MAG: hypothetical protein CSA32_04320 [Desulfobulbus propionicus]